jgi:hypothetical protein
MCPYEGNVYHHDSQQTMAINRLDGGLFVTATLSDDFSFAHSSWDRGIEPWRFQLPLSNDRGAFIAHTLVDRSLLRAGDTVHMKHILRAQTLRGFSSVPDDQLPNRVSIRHVGSEIGVSELPVELGVQYVAGGGASRLPVTLRAQLRPKSVAFSEDYAGYSFANTRLKEGVIHRGTGVDADSDEDGDESMTSRPLTGSSGLHQRFTWCWMRPGWPVRALRSCQPSRYQ